MRSILFINFSGYEETPVLASDGDYVRRIDISQQIDNPGDPQEVIQTVEHMMKSAIESLEGALNGGDRILVALPGGSLIAVALAHRLWSMSQFKLGIVTAVRDRGRYVFDLDGERVLEL